MRFGRPFRGRAGFRRSHCRPETSGARRGAPARLLDHPVLLVRRERTKRRIALAVWVEEQRSARATAGGEHDATESHRLRGRPSTPVVGGAVPCARRIATGREGSATVSRHRTRLEHDSLPRTPFQIPACDPPVTHGARRPVPSPHGAEQIQQLRVTSARRNPKYRNPGRRPRGDGR